VRNRLEALQAFLGVSRLADQTGLDRVGLPVIAAIRPLSHSLTVSFGKGLTREDATTSALMEAAELFFSERPLLQTGGSIVACSVVTGASLLLPWDVISMDLSAGSVPSNASGTGLAAHWDRDQAILHGLLEVIERDAHQRWNASDDRHKAETLVDLHSISEPVSRDLLQRLHRLGLLVIGWALKTRANVPCYMVEIIDRQPRAHAAYVQGAAAHPDEHIAFRKALMEAIQIRLTYIAGSRDDLAHHDYGDRYRRMVETRPRVLEYFAPAHCLNKAMTQWLPASVSIIRLSEWLLCHHATEPLVVDLAPADAGVFVVKTMVPGLEDVPDADDCLADNQRWLEAVP
jgi:YcaO-like protein with predicted kinase domain